MNQETEREINLNVLLTEIDRRNFITFCTFDQNPNRSVVFLGALALAFIVIFLKDKGLPQWLVGLVLLLMVVLLFRIWLGKRKAVKYADSNGILLNSQLLVSLDSEEVMEIGRGDTILKEAEWEEVDRAFENGEYFYIFAKKGKMAFIIPKTAAKGEDAAEVRAMLEEKLGSRFKIKAESAR